LGAATFEVGQSPTIKEAQAIADDIFADFVSEVRACCWKGLESGAKRLHLLMPAQPLLHRCQRQL